MCLHAHFGSFFFFFQSLTSIISDTCPVIVLSVSLPTPATWSPHPPAYLFPISSLSPLQTHQPSFPRHLPSSNVLLSLSNHGSCFLPAPRLLSLPSLTNYLLPKSALNSYQVHDWLFSSAEPFQMPNAQSNNCLFLHPETKRNNRINLEHVKKKNANVETEPLQ